MTALVYSAFLSCSHFVAEANRRLISTDFRDKLMEYNAFYLVSMNHQLDNLDARVSSDVEKFGWHLTNCLFGNVYYTGAIPIIGQSIAFTYLMIQSGDGAWRGVIICYVSFVFFALTNVLLSNWAAKAKYAANIASEDYRHAHGRLNDNAEVVAFYRGGSNEKAKLDSLFGKTVLRNQTYYRRFFFLNFATNWYYWFNTILNYALPGLLLIGFNPVRASRTVAHGAERNIIFDSVVPLGAMMYLWCGARHQRLWMSPT